VLTAWGSDVLLTPHKGFFYRKMVKYVINNSNICTADAEYVIQEIQKSLIKIFQLNKLFCQIYKTHLIHYLKKKK